MKNLCLLVLTVLVAACNGQEMAKAKPKAPATVDLTSPVTQAEARAVFTRAAKVLKPVLKRDYPASGIANGTRPVTRTEVVAEMARMLDASRPAIKYTPVKVRYDAGRLTFSDAKQKANLARLIEYGMVAKLGPIAAGDKETLTVRQFGDAVGFFVARLAEMTHLPSAKWTPSLQKPD